MRSTSLSLLLFLVPTISVAQNFVINNDSICIYNHTILRKNWEEVSKNQLKVKNIINFVPFKHKKRKSGVMYFKLHYPDIGVDFITSNFIEKPFEQTGIWQMRFDYFNKKQNNTSSLVLMEHTIDYSLTFDRFIHDDYWKNYANASFYEEYKYNPVIYANCDTNNIGILFIFENSKPFNIRSVVISLLQH